MRARAIGQRGVLGVASAALILSGAAVASAEEPRNENQGSQLLEEQQAGDGWELVGTRIEGDVEYNVYKFGDGSTAIAQASGGSGANVQPRAGFGFDGQLYMTLSATDQRAFIGGGIAAVSGLAGLFTGPLAGVGAAVVSSALSPYVDAATCASREDGKTTMKIWYSVGGAPRTFLVDRTECVAP